MDPLTAEWGVNFGRLVRYKEEHGDCLVPQKFVVEDGTKLGKWVGTQRMVYSKGTLSEERTQQLEKLGFVWDPLSLSAAWDEKRG